MNQEFPDNFEVNDDLYPSFKQDCTEYDLETLEWLLSDWISMSPHSKGKINFLQNEIFKRKKE